MEKLKQLQRVMDEAAERWAVMDDDDPKKAAALQEYEQQEELWVAAVQKWQSGS